MEDENENENNKSFVKIFGSDNIVTEKSFSKDFNDEKYTTSNQFLLFSKYLDPICSFNDFNYERTNFETNPSQKNTNLFENEKLQTKEIFYNNDEFNKCYLNENLEKKSNKIHFRTNTTKKSYKAKKEYLFKKMFTLITEILIEKLNKKLKKVKLISEYNYDNYKICLNKKIKELLSKNEKNVKKINLLEKNKEQNFNEILNMKLNDFIFNNYETLNEKYEKFFNNYFLIDFKGAKLFKDLGSIEKLINEININKGNNKNKKD